MIKFNMEFFIIVILTQFLGVIGHYEKKCETIRKSGNLISDTTEYVCPREGDPIVLTECCGNGGCCEKKSIFPEINEQLVMIVGVTVITLCVILMIVTVICCFWSKCPCYTTCRANYTASETIIYSLSKDNPNLLMPNESEGSQYAPCLVKIKKVDEF